MTLPDRAEREAAADPGRSFIIQSPAGSGKTELLVRRFLRLLGMVDRPQRILAITFTRKATQEMAERIVERLAAAAAGARPTEAHEQISHRLAQAAMERDRELGWNLLQHPAQLQIHTIDGLCARVAARGAEPGGGVAAMRIAEQPRALYAEAARRLMERVAADETESAAAAALGAMLLRLRGNLGLLQSTLVAELGRRDQWLGLVADALGDMPETLAQRQCEELEILEKTLGRANIRRLAEALAALSGDRDGEPGTQVRTMAALAVADAGDDPNDQVRARREWLSQVATKTGQPMAPATLRKTFREDPPPAGIGYLDEIVAICDGWRKDPEAAVMFQRWINTPPLDAPPDTERLLACMYELLREACAELRVLFSERGACDFQHVAELALAALGEDLAPGEALLLEDGRLEHILVDEFQDTSRMQFDLLCRLTAGWVPGDGRTLFLVGDPMQSIYRFRKAEVALFQRVFTEARLGGVQLEPLQLTANFRSCREIVDFANQNFPAIFQAPSPAATGAVDYVPFTAALGGGGRVAVHPNPVGIGATGEAEQAADLVSRLQAEEPDLKIGILARKRESLSPVAEALARQDIRYEAVDVQDLSRRPVVGDLLALARALLHPCDRVAWLTLLHAPWCALTPAELQAVAGERFEEDILARLGQSDQLGDLPAETRSRLARLRAVMAEALEAAGRQALHRRVEAAWIRLRAPCTLAGPVDLEDAQVFLDLLARVETEQHGDVLSALELELERLRAGSRPAKVQLMTIHKAKGLEFDVVILPALETIAGGSGMALFRQHGFSFGPGIEGTLLAPVNPAGDDRPSLYAYLGRLDSEDEACEAQRVLYVATTRARRELHLFGRWKLKGSGARRSPGADPRSFMHLLWPAFEPHIEAADRTVEDTAEPESDDAEPVTWPQLSLRGAPDPAFSPAAPDPDNVEPVLDGPDRDALALGDALHQWLELIHDHWSEAWLDDWLDRYRPALESSLAHAGARPDSIGALCVRLYGMLRKALDDAHSRALIRPPAGNASYAEVAYYRAEGMRMRRYVLDRLLRDGDGGWQIVDYKTGQPGRANRARWSRQLQCYREVVSAALGEGVERLSVLHIAENGGALLDLERVDDGTDS